MEDIDPAVLSIMAACAFDTTEQMDAAYIAGSEALAVDRQRTIRAAAQTAYDAIDGHLWDASVATKVRDQILALCPR